MLKIIGTEQLSTCDWGKLNKKIVLGAMKYAINQDNWKYVDTAAVYDLGKVEKTIGLNSKIFFKTNILSKVGFRWEKKKNKRANTFININAKDIQAQAEESLTRLKRKKIHTFFLHRIDISQSLSKQIDFLKNLKKIGYCDNIGLCNLNMKDIRNENLNQVDLIQTEMSLICNNSKLIKNFNDNRIILHTCLARGLISNKIINHIPIFAKKNDRRKYLKEFDKNNVSKINFALSDLTQEYDLTKTNTAKINLAAIKKVYKPKGIIVGFRNLDQFKQIENFDKFKNLSKKTLKLFNFYSQKIGNISGRVR
mgnify:CR=1 FL=1